MTVIAYKNGECWSDDLITCGGFIYGRELKLVYRKRDGAIAGASGTASPCSEFLKWAKTGRGKPPAVFVGELSVGQAFIVTRDGVVRDFSGPEPSLIECDFYAIGKGSEIAYGAMMAGCSAKEAVIHACRAYGWPASLHGVNHDGEWSEVPIEEVHSPIHGGRTPRLPSTADGRRT